MLLALCFLVLHLWTWGDPPGPVLFDNWNVDAVQNGPTAPTSIRFTGPTRVTRIETYHWHSAHGAPPGTIALRDEATGKTYGPWQTVGSPGMNGVSNASWAASPDVVLPAGTYQVTVSAPATWACNARSQGQGFVHVWGTAATSRIAPSVDAQGLIRQGWALNARRRFQAAKTVLDQAVVLAPRNANAWANQGWALAGLKRYPEAVTALDKAIALDPRHATAWSNKGFALSNMGQYRPAVGCFDRALALDPLDGATRRFRKLAMARMR